MKVLQTLFLILCLSYTLKAQLPPANLHFDTNYNEVDGLEFAWASSASHCPLGELQEWDCGQPCQFLGGYEYVYGQNIEVNPDEFLVYVILVNHETQRVTISFRGTEGDEQMAFEIIEFGDIPYAWQNISGAYVDYYFGERYDTYIRATLITETQQLVQQYPNYIFVYTGHSLGGALATLACHDAVLSNVVPANITWLFTYGSPRVGNPNFAWSVDQTLPIIFRHTHWRDIVPHVPPCNFDNSKELLDNCTLQDTNELGHNLGNWFWQPWHVGTEIFLNENNSDFTICTANNGEDPLCADQFRVLLNPEDHGDYFNISIGDCGSSSSQKMKTK